MRQTKIYHVHLHTKHNGEQDFYFRSKASISKKLNESVIGMSKEYLCNTLIDEQHHYANSKCVITVIVPE
jgi:hypothetical protein